MSDKTIRGLTNLGVFVLLIVIVFQLSFIDSKLADLNEGGVAAPTQRDTDEPTAAPSAPTAGATKVSFDIEELIEDDDIKGNEDASITIVEWSDYECPFCARFYGQTLASLNSNYIDEGTVKLVYRDFPLSFHPNAEDAAKAAECAGEQGKYYEMHDILFENGVSGGESTYLEYAEDIELDIDDFEECLEDSDIEKEISSDMSDGQAVGVTGTPGFIVHTTNDVTASDIQNAIPPQYSRNVVVLEFEDGVGARVSGALPFDAFDTIIKAMEG